MNRTQLIERIDRVSSTCVSLNADHGKLTAALDDIARLESWAAARRSELVRLLAARPGAFPEADVAASTGTTHSAATRETDRADTLDAAEAFADALDDGDIRPGHVDALTNACKNLTDQQARELLDQQAELAKQAAASSISAFTKHLNRKARELQTEHDAQAKLERQKRNARVRTWVDASDGMWCISGRIDPDTGRTLQQLLDGAVRDLFNEQTPDTAPSDPRERQHHLNALALATLINGTAPASARPGPPIVVVDATAFASHDERGTLSASSRSENGGPRPGGHLDQANDLDQPCDPDADRPNADGADPAGRPSPAPPGPPPPLGIDWGIPIELPMSVLRDVFDIHTPDVVITANGLILHAPGRLDLGRTTRLANRAQRRALRGLYSTCAVPGCSVHYDRCKLHHITWWRNGGRTDLHNLLPVCQHHHTKIHNDGWQIYLGPNRELTIALADGRTMTTGPPGRRAA